MAIILDGTAGIANNATDLSYTGTLTGGTGVVNLGSGQVYKDASGNVGVGTATPNAKLDILAATNTIRMGTSTSSYATIDSNSGAGSLILNADAGNIAGGGSMQFKFAGTERARIDSSGNLLVGTTGVPNGTSIYGSAFVKSSADRSILYLACSSSASAGVAIFYNPNGAVGSINTSGSSTSYVTSSDYRLKEAIAPMTGALAKVALLKPCTYKWKVDGSDGQGFIAHELAEVEAGCVTGEKDAVDAEGNPQYQGIDTSFLIATLSAAIQELHALVKTQDSTITALNERLTALEAANV